MSRGKIGSSWTVDCPNVLGPKLSPSPSYSALALTVAVAFMLLPFRLWTLVLWYVAYAEAHSFSFLGGFASLVVVGIMVGMLVGTAIVLPCFCSVEW